MAALSREKRSVSAADAARIANSERERLLAFAFANADLLLEIGADLTVTFISGAVAHLTGRSEAQTLGAPAADLFAARDRALVAEKIMSLKPSARLAPLDVALRGKGGGLPVTLTACRLDGVAARFFVTIRRRDADDGELAALAHADPQSGLMSADDFAAAAADLQAAHPQAKLTVLELAGFDAFASGLDGARLDDAMGKIGAVLQNAAIDKRTATRLAPDRLGLVHAAGVNVDKIRADIRNVTRAASANGAALDVAKWTMPLQGAGLGAEQGPEVLRYAIRRFAESGMKDFHPASMNEAMQALVEDTIERAAEVKSVIDARNMEVAFQRIVGLKDRRPHHWEALCRPRAANSPSGMVQFLEQVGFSAEFDLMVCAKVIEAIERAAAAGRTPAIAVNVSASSLENEIFLAAFDRLMSGHEGVRRQLMIEITETARLSDLAAADKVIQAWRKRGHAVCLDDFGAGAAGFPYVQALGVDCLKIDGAYVRTMMESARDVAIVRAIVHMCR
jgi:EAL domain-containing protein (putative c-di-GMP-specific phosphodiesterase class I)